MDMDTREPAILIPLDTTLPRTCTYDEGASVLRSHEFGSGIFAENWDILGDTLLGSDGDRHKHLKRVESRLFSPALLAHYEREILDPVMREDLGHVMASPSDDGVVRADLVALGRRMTLRISARVVGLDDITEARIERLTDILGGLADAILIQWSHRSHGEVMREARHHKETFWNEFVRPALVNRRRAAAEVSFAPTDLLGILVTDTTMEWSEDQILKECILYLAAAAFTTATAVTHTVAELDAWVRDHPEDRARLTDLTFLKDAAIESLRVHPGRHVLIRKALRPATMPDGAPVAEGSTVLVDCFRANMDADTYGDQVEVFNPYRTVKDGALPYGLTFGAGRHVCLGRPLVLGADASAGAESRTGTLALLLQGLYSAGLEVDHANPPVRPQSAHDRYERFPVLFAPGDNR
jgi:cytochrome P450